MNIYEKLQSARVKLQEMNLKKSGYNKFANFDYFELKDFLPKINEIFLELKLFSKFDLLENEGVLTIINTENPDERETFVTPKVFVEMKGQNGLQQIGSTHTYLKRYCYYNALEIIINDETEATIGKNETKYKTENKTTDDKFQRRVNYINLNYKKYQKLIDDYLLSKTVTGIDELTKAQITELSDKIVKLEKEGEKNE